MRLEATPLDIARWRRDGRDDILARVQIGGSGAEGGLLWIGSDGSRARQCPFLEQKKDGLFYCGIHEAKPEVCTAHFCQRYLAV